MTDMAFHENWYEFEVPVKRTFLLIILSNKLECKLAAFEKFNLSLPSFMTVRLHIYFVYYLFLILLQMFKNFINNITGYESGIFNSSFIFKNEVKCDKEHIAISNKM